MKEIELKYGCNPNQKPSRLFMRKGELPVQILNGRPGYINFLDALNAWQLVRELKEATNMPAAASFKHVSPAGASIGGTLSPMERRMYFLKEDAGISPLAAAYVRARGTDRLSSYGDFAALSDICDLETASCLRPEVSDGIIAPGYTPEALAILKQKKKGNYNIIQIDPQYEPAAEEYRDVFGVTFEQQHNTSRIDASLLQNVVSAGRKPTPQEQLDMITALITLKYTQSNSVCYVKNGQAVGIGAGQQSRIHCTRLAGQKADNWWLRQAPKVLDLPFRPDIHRADRDNAIDLYISDECDDVLRDGEWQKSFTRQPEAMTASERKEWISRQSGLTVGSDAFFPFGDNVERAHRSGASCIVEPGGSIRDDLVIAAADRHDMVLVFTGLRLFHH